jgi:hypothetical protein
MYNSDWVIQSNNIKQNTVILKTSLYKTEEETNSSNPNLFKQKPTETSYRPYNKYNCLIMQIIY